MNKKFSVHNFQFVKFIIIVAVLTFTFYILPFTFPIYAQVPNPPIPCSKVGNPEFNSLRPYQASATCNTQIANYASYCGNDLTFKDTITVNYPGSSEYQTGCSESGGKVYCNYVVPVTIQKLTINLSGAELPIMGNTEDVKNSQNNDDTLTPADRMSGYVSWYLNGILNRAEYSPLDMSVDIYKIVNYSGPINKLVPQEVQQQQRAETVKNAKDTRHDQVVACIYKVLGGIPAPCYESGLLKSLITQLRLSDWENHLPPVRADYQDYIDYQKALQSWRGKSCAEIKIPDVVPVLGGKGIILCYDDPGKPNYYATLYSYIPLSSTEDLKGKIKIDSVSSASNSENGGATLTGVTFSNQKPADLFFSHMAEDNQLGSLLQDTYTSKGLDKTGNPTNIAAETACESIEVRSNAGDDLFANEITGTLKYTANFTCQYDPITTWIDQQCLQRCLVRALDPKVCPIQCKRTTPPQTCTKNIYVKLSTQSSTPEVDSIWSRLVAGPMSIFKRIFPKTNVEGSVGQIMDIAGSTNITYTGTNITQNNTDLKLPHLGGISEYFLKGIQTALRPKGFGESIEFAPNQASETPSTCTNGGVMPTLPTSQGSCTLKSGNLTIPPTLKAIIEAAAQQYNTPPGLIVAIMYGEGLFDGGNKKDWTEENVKAWATCTKVPGCSETGDDHFMGFVGSDWNDPKNAILADLKKLDPSKNTADRCNLLDAVYGLAWNLHDSADGNGGLPATCFGIRLSAPVPYSCSWTPEQYESAIKVSESGYTSYCHTTENSCVTGGGNAAACPGGDTCETVSNRYSRPSHNACIWDVAHRY